MIEYGCGFLLYKIKRGGAGGARAQLSCATMALSKPRVAVIGAGVIGLSIATRLAETYGRGLDVTVMADKFTPNTTSDGAGGIFVPYTVGFSEEGARKLQRWATQTFHYLTKLYESGMRDEIGLSLVTGHDIHIKPGEYPLPWCKDLLFDFEVLKNQSLESALDLPPVPAGKVKEDFLSESSLYSRTKNATIFKFKTFVLEGKTYLPWLMKKFQALGGLIIKHKVDSLGELENYDIIINCTGLAARELVGDKSVYPIRGQSVAVNIPSLGKFYDCVDDDLLYIIPHKDYLVLGGTAEANNWSTTPDPKTREEILRKCSNMLPTLQGAEVVSEWACLRPAREEVCLELENPGTSPSIIHCYGHGGQGIVVHWGCVQDVMKLVEKCLKAKGDAARPMNAKL